MTRGSGTCRVSPRERVAAACAAIERLRDGHTAPAALTAAAVGRRRATRGFEPSRRATPQHQTFMQLLPKLFLDAGKGLAPARTFP